MEDAGADLLRECCARCAWDEAAGDGGGGGGGGDADCAGV